MALSVDIELADMAREFGVSIRKLMAGIMNGTYDRIGDEDLVRGDKGDPLFFRIGRMRAYSLFGDDLDRVEKDLSTVEEMSTSDTESRENTTDVGGPVSVPSSGGEVATSSEPETSGDVATSMEVSALARGETATATEVDSPAEKASRENNPPARTNRDPQGGAVQPTTEQTKETAVQVQEPDVHTEKTATRTAEGGKAPVRANPSQGTSTARKAGQAALVLAGAGIFAWLLSGDEGQQSQTRGLSGGQRQEVFDQGYNGFYQGTRYNPYDLGTEAGELYEQGWREGRRQAIKNPMIDARLA